MSKFHFAKQMKQHKKEKKKWHIEEVENEKKTGK